MLVSGGKKVYEANYLYGLIFFRVQASLKVLNTASVAGTMKLYCVERCTIDFIIIKSKIKF